MCPPAPASSSSLLVTGDVQFNWSKLFGCAVWRPVPSGLVVAEPPLEQLAQRIWSSWYAENLLRGVACHVSRRPRFLQLVSEYAGRLKSGSHVHLVTSPAFRLWNMPAAVL